MVAKGRPLIAIVDDDESVCRALSRLVRSLEMEAQAFGSGRELLDLLEALPSFQPRSVVLDVQMPGVNGFDVQREIRSLRPGLPIIMITAFDEPGFRERALAGGAAAYLRKPFNDAVFAQTLRALPEQGGAEP